MSNEAGEDVWTAFEELLDVGNVAYGFILGSRRAPSDLISELLQAINRAQALITEHDLARLAAHDRQGR